MTPDLGVDIAQRIQEIGTEVFEFAEAAQPRFWQSAWWLERITQFVDRDPMLRARVFQFVECLPALSGHNDVMGHLAEYLDDSRLHLPAALLALVRPDGWFSSLRTEAIGRITRFGATRMAARFLCGFDVPSAVRAVQRLRSRGMAFTLDVLGESTTSYAQAEVYASVYHDLIDRVTPLAAAWPIDPLLDFDGDRPMPRVNLSIKLSGLDPFLDAIDPDRAIRTAGRLLRPLLRHARSAGAFINIDMESYKFHDLTLDLFKKTLMEDEFRDWPDVGIVLQAYLREGEKDLADLLEWAARRGTRFALRLVKGAYWDAETAAAVRAYKQPPVWSAKWESDACHERMTAVMLRNADLIRPAFASHNVRSLAVVCSLAEKLKLPPSRYEVQMLYGMGDPLKSAMVCLGRCLRVYCPYGDLMPGMGYLIRRLLENTSNEGFLKQSSSDRASQARLLADPASARPPSSPPPGRYYQNTDPEEPMSNFKNAAVTNFADAENRRRMTGALQYVRGEFGRTYPLVINGQNASTQEWFASRNPSQSAEIIGRVALASPSDVDRAVASAAKAFGLWRRTSATHRADLLRKLADRLESRRFELTATMILEVGKPWRESDADVTEAIDHCRYYADQIERIESRPRLRNLPGENNALTYSPKGVCAVISPWAFPLAILTGMTTAALAGGNTVVMKPARKASVVAAKFAEVLHDVGCPPGVVNFLPGVGDDIGPRLVEHGDVNVVAFTGSAAVGTEVIRSGAIVRPGQAFIKKLIVEMGGKNAILVDDDADLDGAVQAIVESAFAFAGQKCSSCSRVIVLSRVYDAFCERLREAVRSLPIGPSEAPSTIVGPVVDMASRDRILSHVETGRKEGRVLVEGSLPSDAFHGYFVPPTVLTDVAPDARVAQEEIFGPVVVLLKANDFDHALNIFNGTRYALTGGLFSRSPVNIEKARREMAVGNLYINRRITGSQVDAQPFGGFRLSGTGVKAGSPDYLLHFMDARCITENTQRSGFVPGGEQRTVA